MATLHGDTQVDVTDDRQLATASTHLGKRKRSESPRKMLNLNLDLNLNGNLPPPSDSTFQQNLLDALNKIKSDDPTTSLLHCPLPPTSLHPPDSKRPRLSVDDHRDNDNDNDNKTNIESRIHSGEYTSFAQLEQDVNTANNALLTGNRAVNGHPTHVNTPNHASNLIALLSAHLNPTTKNPTPYHLPGHIITLRSHTDKGTQQLYSGLQIQQNDHHDENENKKRVIDGRRLPNGFDLTLPATMDSTLLAPNKSKRLFGDVFRPRPATKQLEQPRPRPANRITTLNFGVDPSADKSTPINRQDYKHQSLPTATWLSYTKATSSSDPDAVRKQRERALTATDFRAALVGNELATTDLQDADALFNKVFSSFTPSSDSSKGLINQADQNRAYWRRYGAKRMNKIFYTDYPDLDNPDPKFNVPDLAEDDFRDVVANFTPIDNGSDLQINKDDLQNIDQVQDEVSELLETVHSFQSIRAASNRNTEISRDEFGTYDILRSQLSILISSLPPFAVAKLDGDKLNDLNISTNIIIDGADYRGTGQPDDFTLQKYRAAQQATSAATRAPQPQPVRTQYPTPGPAQRYGATYGQTAPQPAYPQRTPINYQQTPTASRSYQPNTYNPQAAVQQFQRPNQNGYNQNAQSTPSFTQTPSQPGYQQRAQQQALAYGRTASPPKPMVNGQNSYYNQGQHQRPPVQSYVPQQTPNLQALNAA